MIGWLVLVGWGGWLFHLLGLDFLHCNLIMATNSKDWTLALEQRFFSSFAIPTPWLASKRSVVPCRSFPVGWGKGSWRFSPNVFFQAKLRDTEYEKHLGDAPEEWGKFGHVKKS